SDRVCSETADPENVHDGEERLEHHLQDHRNGEQENGAIEIAGGEVLVRAAQGLSDGTPERRRRSGRGGRCGDRALLRLHEDLNISTRAQRQKRRRIRAAMKQFALRKRKKLERETDAT